MRNPFSESAETDRETAWYEAPREPPVDGPTGPAGPPTPPRRWTRWKLIRWAMAGALALFMAAVAWLAVTAPLSKSLQPIAPIDPLVAGQVLLSALNVAYECRDIAARVPAERAVALYMSILLRGVLSDR